MAIPVRTVDRSGAALAVTSRWSRRGAQRAPAEDAAGVFESGADGQPVAADVRASDAERSEVADRLGRHFSDGRLDQAEFQARLEQAMEAKKRSDLQGLFDDLPRLESEPAPEPEAPLST